jgi:ssDNA-binding Zn-finger/Zn-ribbon topoisomerase 1
VNDGRSEIRWSPRVPKWKVRRLYELDAQGILDEKLLDDVGFTLLLRCQDILAIHEAKRGRVKCPRCAEQRKHTIIERASRKDDVRDEVITCPECGWQITWGEYALSFKRKQLNSGGALTAFTRYIKEFKAARRPQQRMLAIDQLIHEFHYPLRAQPDLPCRPVGVNLIQGKLRDVVKFLDELTYGQQTTKGLEENRAAWLEEMAKIPWIDFVSSDGQSGSKE